MTYATYVRTYVHTDIIASNNLLLVSAFRKAIHCDASGLIAHSHTYILSQDKRYTIKSACKLNYNYVSLVKSIVYTTDCEQSENVWS